jgi:hypothetical protein
MADAHWFALHMYVQMFVYSMGAVHTFSCEMEFTCVLTRMDPQRPGPKCYCLVRWDSERTMI